MYKKVIFSIIVTILFLCGSKISVDAAEIVSSGTCGENVTYTLNSDGLLTISGSGGYSDVLFEDKVVDVVIEEGITRIEDFAFSDIGIESITLPKSLESIGEFAFEDCSKLKKVIFSEGLTTIEEYAFYGCTSLEYIHLPKSLKKVEQWTFYDCPLRHVYYAGTEKQWKKANIHWTSYVFAADGIHYKCVLNGDSDYKYKITGEKTVEFVGITNSNMKSLKIPKSVRINNKTYKVTTIGEEALKGNKKIANVTLGANIKGIGYEAFCGCTKLNKITFNSALQKIGERAFFECKSLTSIKIPNKVTELGEYAFQRCAKLSKVTLGSSLKKIGNAAFYECKALENITIPSKVTTIDGWAFSDCKKLKTITIKSTKLKKVGENAFKGIQSKAKIKVPSKKLGAYKKLLKGKGQGNKVKIQKM